MTKTASKEPSYIAPERLYSLAGFRAASGVSETRMREARMQGIEIPMLVVGKRKFIRGVDAISFIERLAENYQAN
jgi:hypothetical protein